MLAALVTACAGCPERVTPGTVSPAEESPSPVASRSDESPTVSVAPSPPVDDSDPEAQATPIAQPATPSGVAAADPEAGELPWKQTGSTSSRADTEATNALFGAVASAPTESEPSDQADQEEELDDMEAFLEQQYGSDLLSDASAEVEAEEASSTAPEPDPPAVSATTPTPIADPSIGPVSLDDLWGPPASPAPGQPKPLPALDSAPAVESEPARSVAEDLPTLPPTPAFEDQPLGSPAKEPTTTEPADSPSLEDLWATDPAPPPASPEALPEPAATADALFPARPEPAPATAPPAVDLPPRVASREPLAAEGIDALPSVPVLSYNTRHLSWLLGGKLGLAELADLDGATPNQIDAWSDEASRLAKQLRVELTDTTERPRATPQRVQRLIGQASEVGAEVARRHGDDHAALLEIAVKTNALLALATDRPELAEPVGRAIGAAAERALLPRYLWIDTVRSLRKEASPDEIHDAVIELHQRVEPFLR